MYLGCIGFYTQEVYVKFKYAALGIWLGLFFMLVLAPWQVAQAAEGTFPTSGAADESTAPLCRFGVNGDVAGFDIAPFRVSWYVDYGAHSDAVRPNGIQYMPIIRLRQQGESYRYSLNSSHIPLSNQTELIQTIQSLPGAEWFIGNEPDRRDYQDDVEPRIYAQAYHELYTLIKTTDPTAKVIVGAIVQPTPLRLQYLDMVLDAYHRRYHQPLPADGWSFHNFILNEKACEGPNDYDCWGAGIPPGINASEGLRVRPEDNDDMDLFIAQVRRFRQWLKDRGYQGARVYLSEYGVLMPNIFEPPADFPPSRVNAFMNATFDYLRTATDPVLGDPNDGYRLVQRFSWYSVQDQTFNGYLFEPDPANPGSYRRSPMGDNFVNYTANIAAEHDLTVSQIVVNPPAPLASEGNVDFTVRARVANSGNLLAKQSFKVRFYNGDPQAGGVQIGAEQTVSLSGCGDYQDVEILWPNVAPGNYTIYVVVDPAQAVVETNENNNIRSRAIFFADHRIFLPIVGRNIYVR
uniref:CARDB domain-containing protein n=1 Tax=Litorilinea aerophila TaxID=1204385 RepID=A0A540VHL5_9CHLR